MMKPLSLLRSLAASSVPSSSARRAGSQAAPSGQRCSGIGAAPARRKRVVTSWSRGSQEPSASGGGAEDALQLQPETFYDLLNVPPTASRRAIRQAYLDVMKECHPDKSNAEAHDFCVLLNEIYETLSDPQKRAAYDAISGLAEDSINPFTDTTHERDQVFVDEVTCIGCRNCANVCPSSFKIEDFHGRARVARQNADLPEKLQEAIDTCPVSCIHWVSAPQLALLEQAMARMERVAVWSMFMGSGSAKDVFLEASLAWEKRQANARRVRAAAAAATSGSGSNSAGAPPWTQWWGNMTSSAREGAAGSRFYEGVNKARGRWGAAASDDGGSAGSSDEDWAGAGGDGAGGEEPQRPPLSERQARGIATLAARAARASRTWRTMQEVTQRLRNRPLQLAAVSARGGEVVGLDGGESAASSSSSVSSVSDS